MSGILRRVIVTTAALVILVAMPLLVNPQQMPQDCGDGNSGGGSLNSGSPSSIPEAPTFAPEFHPECPGSQLTISGPHEITSPGTQYVAGGGIVPYDWSVSGDEASITDTGYLIIGGSPCGSTVTVTLTDACDQSASLRALVVENGHWQLVHTTPYSECPFAYYLPSISGECIEDTVKYVWYVQGWCGSQNGPNLAGSCCGICEEQQKVCESFGSGGCSLSPPYYIGPISMYSIYELVCD